MALLDVANLAFGFASTPLLRDVTFRLEAGDRVALVAPNGTGKTTLLRLIPGEIAPDAGTVVRAKGTRLGFYRQSDEANSAGTVRATLRQGFAPLAALEAALRDAEEAAASGEPEAIAELTEAADLERTTGSLSGGERGRLALGTVLAGEPEAPARRADQPPRHSGSGDPGGGAATLPWHRDLRLARSSLPGARLHPNGRLRRGRAGRLRGELR